MANVRLYLDTRRAKKDGSYPVKLAVFHEKQLFFSTGVDCLPEHWEDGGVSKADPRGKLKNLSLSTKLTRVENLLYRLELNRSLNITDKHLKQLIDVELHGEKKADAPTPKVFTDYLDDFISNKSNPGTIRLYEETAKKLKLYDASATFDTITVDWLNKFDKWMTGKGLSVNARGIEMRNIRAVFNYGIDNEVTALYPFRRFKIKTEETAKRSLTIEELRTLRDYPCEPHQEMYRDIFMLSFYLIGINPADLLALTGTQGGKVQYRRAKTGKLYSIDVLPEAQAIIDKYRGRHLVGAMDGYAKYKDLAKRINNNLQDLGPVARVGRGGKKVRTPLFPDITMYWARHTWATIAASLDIPKETISAALGHGTKTVTDIYIRFDERKIQEANRKVLEYVRS